MLKEENKNNSETAGHNGQTTLAANEPDERIKALVRFVARRAAENDMKELVRALEGGDT